MRKLRRMRIDGHVRELRATMRRLWQMRTNGQLKELRVIMRKLRQMRTNKQLRKLRVIMRKLFWKVLRMLMLECFYISIGNRKHVMRIIRVIRASVSSCQKNVAKKFETLIVKHAVPNVN
ncbi:unnamed protein product [Sphagnum jensenii]